MKMLWRRPVLAAALSLTAAVGGLLVAGTAHAQKVTSGTFSFSGDSGDYISQGKSWSYSTSNGDALDVSSSSGSLVHVSLTGYNGDWWTLDIDAPGTKVLAPGTYSAAHRYPFNGTGPGLSLSGEGRGCNELTGSFTVQKAVFGSDGYVQSFDATFEQHCEGGTPAARGKIHIANAPAPTKATPKRTATTSPRATTARPRSTTTRSPAATANPQATPTSGPSAAAAATDTGADNPETRAYVRNDVRTPLLLFGVGIVAFVGLIAVGLVTVGLIMHVRGQ